LHFDGLTFIAHEQKRHPDNLQRPDKCKRYNGIGDGVGLVCGMHVNGNWAAFCLNVAQQRLGSGDNSECGICIINGRLSSCRCRMRQLH